MAKIVNYLNLKGNSFKKIKFFKIHLYNVYTFYATNLTK